MKRTLSGDLAPTPSSTHSLNDQPAELNENQHQQQAVANDGEPTMHTPNANDPIADNPLLGFEAGEELPDWEEFAQMLPHTPPVENRRDVQDDEDFSSSEDVVSSLDPSTEDSAASIFDEDIITHIREGINSGNDTVTIRNFCAREVTETLELCKQNTKITYLRIDSPQYPSDSRQATITRLLTEFFEECHSVRSFEIRGHAFGPLRIEASLLSALFRNKGIVHLGLHWCPLTTSSPDESESLIQSIKQNTTLKIFQLEGTRIEDRHPHITDALICNSSLTALEVGILNQPDICQSLTAHLKSNQQLKTLVIGDNYFLKPTDLEKLFAEVKNHPTLEYFNAEALYFSNPLEANLIKQLTGNRTLKELLLPKAREVTADAVEALIELVKDHPKLTSIHLGSVPQQHQLRMKLACGLKSNTRLVSIGIEFSNFLGIGNGHEDIPLQMIEFMKEIGNIPQLRKVRFESFANLDWLSEFLRSCPQIREIDLPDWHADLKEEREKLLSIVKQSGQMTHFTSQGQKYSDLEEILEFRKELNQALRLNQQIELNIETASAAMKRTLDEKSITDESLPFVPLDVTNELAKAIARHVPPEKAKAIFDELIVHAPVHQKEM